MITDATWTEIRALRQAGTPIKRIARNLGVAPNTVRRALRSDAPPRYERAPVASVVLPYIPDITGLLRNYPALSVPTIAEMIDWPYSLSLLRRHVARLRPPMPVAALAPPREPQPPGHEVLCGIWRPPALPVGFGQRIRLPVLVMVFPYSRAIQAVMVPSQDFAHLWLGQWTLLSGWGRMPWTFVWEDDAITDSGRRALEEYERCLQFRGQSFTSEEDLPELHTARRDLGKKFLAGRSFRSPGDFNAQLHNWSKDGGHVEALSTWDQELRGMLRPDQYLALTSSMSPSAPLEPEQLPPGEQLASVLDRPSIAEARTVPSPKGIVSCGGNGYLVGSWGHGRRLKVGTTLDRIVISSGGYQTGGLHQVEYERAWARNVVADTPLRHLRIVGHRHEELEGP